MKVKIKSGFPLIYVGGVELLGRDKDGYMEIETPYSDNPKFLENIRLDYAGNPVDTHEEGTDWEFKK